MSAQGGSSLNSFPSPFYCPKTLSKEAVNSEGKREADKTKCYHRSRKLVEERIKQVYLVREAHRLEPRPGDVRRPLKRMASPYRVRSGVIGAQQSREYAAILPPIHKATMPYGVMAVRPYDYQAR